MVLVARSFSVRSFWIIALFSVLSCVLAQDQTTCSQLKAQRPDIEVTWPHQLDYTTINNDYWSTACTAQKPECIILPASAQELSDVLIMLTDNGERFAVKSGGHSPNTGYASIDGGPLISMRRMNHVQYNAGSKSVHVGPGNDWQDVTKALLGTGVTIVGGRMGEVGVSGLTLGGELQNLRYHDSPCSKANV
jgi:FAD/FMN-containing dehydrogenase